MAYTENLHKPTSDAETRTLEEIKATKHLTVEVSYLKCEDCGESLPEGEKAFVRFEKFGQILGRCDDCFIRTKDMYQSGELA
jgi:hypothetical protein